MPWRCYSSPALAALLTIILNCSVCSHAPFSKQRSTTFTCRFTMAFSERSCPVSGSVGGRGRCPAGAAASGRQSRSSSRMGPRGCSFSGFSQPGDIHAAFDVSQWVFDGLITLTVSLDPSRSRCRGVAPHEVTGVEYPGVSWTMLTLFTGSESPSTRFCTTNTPQYKRSTPSRTKPRWTLSTSTNRTF